MTAVTDPTAGIDLNPQFLHALDVMDNTNRSVFVTGRAGTGKSTLLTYFRRNTKKKIAVLAPTGVAALNVQGQTIHSFFGFRPNITIERVKRVRLRDESKSIYRKIDAIVIDEVSMVRADLLDCVDRFLRLNGPDADAPFGGIQMVFIGDLYQLPPVVSGAERSVFGTLYDSPYFYSARSFASLEMEFIELEKVYRQQDRAFIDLLNAIRNNSITEEGLRLLNQRCMPSFEPPPGQFYIYLTTTNDLAGQINDNQLARLQTPPHVFEAHIEGDFGEEYLPTKIDLHLRVGAQIMMLNNDPEERWVNGTIGQVSAILEDGIRRVIVARLDDDETVDIAPFTWEIYRFFVAGGQLQSEVVGRFTQYPLMLAWAVTIHKSQGKTFDRVIIDIGRGAFAHGQTYVALSRCTTLEGIVLKKPLLRRHVLTDYRVMRFLTGRKYEESEKSLPLPDKVKVLEQAARQRTPVHIIYLKTNDEKTFRTIMPEQVGEMEYQGKKYVGVRAFCLTSHEQRTFRVDRILEMRV